jgi:hypothetical protein
MTMAPFAGVDVKRRVFAEPPRRDRELPSARAEPDVVMASWIAVTAARDFCAPMFGREVHGVR